MSYNFPLLSQMLISCSVTLQSFIPLRVLKRVCHVFSPRPERLNYFSYIFPRWCANGGIGFPLVASPGISLICWIFMWICPLRFYQHFKRRVFCRKPEWSYWKIWLHHKSSFQTDRTVWFKAHVVYIWLWIMIYDEIWRHYVRDKALNMSQQRWKGVGATSTCHPHQRSCSSVPYSVHTYNQSCHSLGLSTRSNRSCHLSGLLTAFPQELALTGFIHNLFPHFP